MHTPIDWLLDLTAVSFSLCGRPHNVHLRVSIGYIIGRCEPPPPSSKSPTCSSMARCFGPACVRRADVLTRIHTLVPTRPRLVGAVDAFQAPASCHGTPCAACCWLMYSCMPVPVPMPTHISARLHDTKPWGNQAMGCQKTVYKRAHATTLCGNKARGQRTTRQGFIPHASLPRPLASSR